MLRANATDPDAAIAEWDALVERMALLTEANDVLPLMYLRQDLNWRNYRAVCARDGGSEGKAD